MREQIKAKQMQQIVLGMTRHLAHIVSFEYLLHACLPFQPSAAARHGSALATN